MTEGLALLLESQAVADVVEQVIELVSANGGIASPRIVEHVRTNAVCSVAENSSLIIELAIGTARARRLGKGASGWLFTNMMAEQATHPEIAAHHAAPYHHCSHVLEVCTGAGLDTAALAGAAQRVTTVEANPTVAMIARGNFIRNGITNVELKMGTWTGAEVPADIDGVWADPSRRDGGRRMKDASGYEPPLNSIPAAAIVGIKIGPGHAVDEAGWTSEYIGYKGECRERILWKSPHIRTTTVTLVDADIQWRAESELTPQIVPQAAVLIEPHNALIASGKVGSFFAEIGAGVFDPRIAYGAMNVEPPPSSWYTVYRVMKIDTGVNVRRIQQSIRELGWGPTTIFKKRGWDRDPEGLRQQLTFREDGAPGVVIVMRVGNAHQTVYALRQ